MTILQHFMNISFFWALPLLPLCLFFWALQHRSEQTRKRLGAAATGQTAAEAARNFLHSAEMGSIPVEPGLDHSRNVCDPQTGRLLISPSFWEDRTLGSVALALRAAGLAAAFHRTPRKIQLIRRFDIAVQVFFWISFTLMGFGLMGTSFPVTLAAYGLLALTCGCFFAQILLEKALDAETLRQILQCRLADEEQLVPIAAIFRADRLIFGNRCCVVERPHDPEIREKIPSSAFSPKQGKNNAPRGGRYRNGLDFVEYPTTELADSIVRNDKRRVR